MSGWMYIKKGIINDSEVGPLADAALLQLAHDGAVTPKTLVVHPVHTGGQWLPLSQIPAALKNYEQGVCERKAEADKKQREADELKAAKQAEKEARRAELNELEQTPAVADFRTQRIELVDDPRSNPFAPGSIPTRPLFRCPFCSSTLQPVTRAKISTGGWILFIVMFLFLCWPLCWIGLLIKDEQTYCSQCGMKLA